MTRRAVSTILVLATILVVSLVPSCRCVRADGNTGDGDTLTNRAALLRLIDHQNGIVSARILDPWNEGGTLGTYLLVDRSVPDDSIPAVDGAVVIRVPVRSALVYSSVHTGGFEELDALSAVTGVADGSYFTSASMRKGIDNGSIVDVGNSMSPSLEKIVDLAPEVAIISPYENSGNGVLDKTGIAILPMADYMETTPLGRAEWILLIGALNGKLDAARDIYTQVEKQYAEITEFATKQPDQPLTLSEVPFNGVWYQPGGASYMANMIRDAGGRPLLDDDASTGSVQMDIANVYDRAVGANVWLIKTAGDITPAGIASSSKLLPGIRAFANGNVWNANTLRNPYYDDIAFHPEKILRDMAVIIHPALTDTLGAPAYFAPVR